MIGAGENYRRYQEEARGIDPDVLDDIGETHADSPEAAEAHADALRQLLGATTTFALFFEQEHPTQAATIRRNAAATRRRRAAAVGPQYGEEEGVGYPGGVPHYMQPHQPLSVDQAVLNHQRITEIKEQLDRAA